MSRKNGEVKRLPTHISAPRFIAAGGFASLVNWGVRFPLSSLMPFQWAVAVAYVIGMAVGFCVYSKWVFPGSRRALKAQIWRFVLVNLAGLATVVLCASWFSMLIARTGQSLSASQGAAHIVAIGIGALVNFLGHRLVTFS